MKIQLLYFARLRERFGCGSETLECTASTVADVLDILRARGGAFAEELAADRVFRVALGQQIARADSVLTDGIEMAIFPPVTGG